MLHRCTDLIRFDLFDLICLDLLVVCLFYLVWLLLINQVRRGGGPGDKIRPGKRQAVRLPVRNDGEDGSPRRSLSRGSPGEKVFFSFFCCFILTAARTYVQCRQGALY